MSFFKHASRRSPFDAARRASLQKRLDETPGSAGGYRIMAPMTSDLCICSEPIVIRFAPRAAPQ